MDLSRLRNLSIVAHVDHGKSTLADRLLELCSAVDPRDMRAQYYFPAPDRSLRW